MVGISDTYGASGHDKELMNAAAFKIMMEALSPQLASSIEYAANTNMLADVAQSLSPLAIVGNTSIADTANKLLKGTALEGILNRITSDDKMIDIAER